MNDKDADSEVSAFLQGVSDLLPIKRMGELDKWALASGIDSESRSKLIPILGSFISNNSSIIETAKKYVKDVSCVVSLQKPISKEDRAQIGRALRDFVEGCSDSSKACEYVCSAVEIIGDAFVLAKESIVSDPPKTEAPKTEAPKTEAPKTEAPKTESPKTVELSSEPSFSELASSKVSLADSPSPEPLPTSLPPSPEPKKESTPFRMTGGSGTFQKSRSIFRK